MNFQFSIFKRIQLSFRVRRYVGREISKKRSLVVRCYIGLLEMTVILALSIFFNNSTVLAFDSSLPNNKFGIHLADVDSNNLKKAAELVNSSGGKWGYVTLVIQENDRNQKKWQDVFNQLRQLHLIPIIRLATNPEGSNWRRPNKEDAEGWTNFLNSLNWVVKDRYIVLFNEPNHASEWGGAVDPSNYAEVSYSFAKKLQEKNSDFFVILAGFDSSAPSSSPSFEDQGFFLQRVLQDKPDLFNYIDGWASHSYPNPGFSGSPFDVGRGTVRNYEWELSLLKQFGIEKELPVFITETGWPQTNFSSATIGEFIKTAFGQVWFSDSRVRAVTPFVLSYQGEPFSSFSWKKLGEENFYQHFFIAKVISKTKGEPQQDEKGQILINLPKELLTDSNYRFSVRLKNTGQAIWGRDEGYQLSLEGLKTSFFADFDGVQPGFESDVDFFFKTSNELGKKEAKVFLNKGDKKILESKTWRFNILPLPSLSFRVNLFPKVIDQGGEFEIQIFDPQEQIVYKRQGVGVEKGEGKIDAVRNVYFGGKYRVVILKPHYLPRQTYVVFHKGENKITFKRLLPLDFNLNGHLDFGDFISAIVNPSLLKLILP